MAVDETKWYVRAKGKVLGPFSWPQLEAMRNRGQLSRFHELSQDRRDWIGAGGLADLFPPEDAAPGGYGIDPGNPAAGRAPVAGHRESWPASAAPGATSAEPAVWFHAKDGGSVGPLHAHDLRALAARGEIHGATLVWKEGMSGWAACREIPELMAIFNPAAGPSPSLPPAPGPPRTSGLAIASLVLGLLGLCGLGSLLAVIFGGVSLSQISRSRGALEGRGMAIAGLVLGIIGLICMTLFLFGFFGEMGRQQAILQRLRGD